MIIGPRGSRGLTFARTTRPGSDLRASETRRRAQIEVGYRKLYRTSKEFPMHKNILLGIAVVGVIGLLAADYAYAKG